MADLIGQTLKGRYRVEALLGRGGMAEVYKAWDNRRHYAVALKVLRADLAEDWEFVRRFQREAQALAQLAHANIVRFYSFEQDARIAFIVMDVIEGDTLQARIFDARGPLPLANVVDIARQVCMALDYAHHEGVIHRDIKPGNIMIQPDGRALLSDFGIAKAVDAATATTATIGTPAYMSPEQCRGIPPDARTDVYSLGTVVYEMLAGRRPFVGESAPGTITTTAERIRWEQIHAGPIPLRRVNPAVPAAVEQIVLRALAKDRDQRWPSAAAFGQALEQASGLPAAGPHAVEPRKPEPTARRAAARPVSVGDSPSKSGLPLAPPAAERRPAAATARRGGWPWRLWAGIGGAMVVLLVSAIAVILLQNFGIFGSFENLIWVVLFGAGGLIFLGVFLSNREHWWAIIPGFTLLGLAGVIGFGERLGALGGAFFLAAIGLSFWVIYALKREFWWAMIPGGALITLALVAGLADSVAGEVSGGLSFLGLGAAFGLVYLMPTAEGRMKWALIPAAVLVAMGLLVIVAPGGWINLLWPLAFILGGAFLVYYALRARR